MRNMVRNLRFFAGVLAGVALVFGVYAVLSHFGVTEILRSRIARYVPGITDEIGGFNPEPLEERLSAKGFRLGQPVLLRLFKEEDELELWMDRGERYDLALTFRICAWSGDLGPKLAEGDGQSPEGFYLVSRRQLKPDSDYYRAINVGFPNAFDRRQGRTGSFLMIHGDCVSIGCYAMTDRGIDDIYTAVEKALRAGQRAVPVQIFPFRMTNENLTRHAGKPWLPFWENLAEGDRLFAATGKPPEAGVCGERYVFAEQGQRLPGGSRCRKIAGW